jgi:hypothetical protein
MKFLEASGKRGWPIGEGDYACNIKVMFPYMLIDGIKELELTEKEYAAFFQAYTDALIDKDIASGSFSFCGIKISLIK